VFGGQYGSEGKGCVTEYYAKQLQINGKAIVSFAESAPNAGHANSKLKTRLMPSCSIWADWVLIGPDAVIDLDVLTADMEAIKKVMGSTDAISKVKVIVHERAAWLKRGDAYLEADLVKRISSTGTGSGAGRAQKYIWRDPLAVVAAHKSELIDSSIFPIEIVTPSQWMDTISMMENVNWLVECSQGVLLDPNWGWYPSCTSRNTSPRVIIERSGLGGYGDWLYAGVYRYHPVRTGGPSGPTGGRELNWTADLQVPPEITAVTKRVRRVFEFCQYEYKLSLSIARPHQVFWTHIDYLKLDMRHPKDRQSFAGMVGCRNGYIVDDAFASSKPGEFFPIGAL
jgi:adenylosuccinate synthase